jgi:hypothetical protein
MDAFLRLLRYATPTARSLPVRPVAMVVYGPPTPALAYLIKPIIDDVLIAQGDIGVIAVSILAVYLMKGSAPISQVTDGGARPSRRDGRAQPALPHMLDQSAAFFARRAVGQLCRASTTTSA